jgi:ferrous iron transport protein B
MSTCCESSDSLKPLRSGAKLTIALAGNPNSGKTTIFNALTGLRQKVANYPGVTVEKKTGRCRLDDGTWIDIIDLPGTYSLISRSPDEVVAMEVLRGLRKGTPPPDAVIVVVDASNLQRNLYLVSQLIELGRPMVVALNMMDIAERRGLKISAERLEAELGVPVVPVVGHKHQGITPLKEAIGRAAVAPLPQWQLPDAMKEELAIVGGGLSLLEGATDPRASREPSGSAAGLPGASGIPRSLDHYHALAERLLIGDIAGDLSPIAGREPVKSLLSGASSRLTSLGIDPMQADIEAHYHWIDRVAAGALIPACAAIDSLGHHTSLAPVVTPNASRGGAAGLSAGASSGGPEKLEYAPAPTLTERIDRILIHKVWGLIIFAAIMGTLFVTIFWLAKPIMDGVQSAVTAAGSLASSRLPAGPIKDLINDGIFAGVGAVVVFVPQIALLFMFLSILEDSGYLARAAFLMDRLLSKVGLHCNIFIPLLSSFACAIPGIMATRTIESRRDRLATILIAPFMSCSARLPVYTLLIGTFFAGLGAFAQAGIMLACYALGILAAVGTALLFKRTFLKGMPSSFILEMPTYKVPQLSTVARQVWSNASEFLKKAGTIIFALSVVLWALAYYPRLPSAKRDAVWQHARVAANDPHNWQEHANGLRDVPFTEERLKFADNAVAAAQSEYSFAGRFGHALAPVIRPLGYDWKMGVGLVAAFAAREVFVSTESIVYATGDTEEGGTAPLSQAMRADRRPDGKAVWTPLVAISLLVWFVLAMQCMSTVAIVRRETGGWGWPVFMILYMNGLAYVACLIVYQVGAHFFGQA